MASESLCTTARPRSPTPSWPPRPANSLPPWSSRVWPPGTGSPSGASTVRSGWWPSSASSQAGAVLVPVNTRFKGHEAADILARSGARLLVTVTDFLGTDYVAPARRGRRRAARPSRRSWSSGATPPATPCDWDEVPCWRHARGPERSATPQRRPRPRRPVRHLVHLGHDRGAQGRGHDPRPHADRGDRLGGHDGPARRRPSTSR